MFAARRSALSTRQLLRTQRRWGSHAAHEPVNESFGVSSSSPADRDQTRVWKQGKKCLNGPRTTWLTISCPLNSAASTSPVAPPPPPSSSTTLASQTRNPARPLGSPASSRSGLLPRRSSSNATLSTPLSWRRLLLTATCSAVRAQPRVLASDSPSMSSGCSGNAFLSCYANCNFFSFCLV